MEIVMNPEDVVTPWVKSSFSNTGANCVELARGRNGSVAVRDSKDSDGALLAFSPERWAAFTCQVKQEAAAMAAT